MRATTSDDRRCGLGLPRFDDRRADNLERAKKLTLIDVLAETHAELGEAEEECGVGLGRERERLVRTHGALVRPRRALELLRDVDGALNEGNLCSNRLMRTSELVTGRHALWETGHPRDVRSVRLSRRLER